MKKLRVGVVMGGPSKEREVSLKTGEGVCEALESRGHDVVRIVLGEHGSSPDTQLRRANLDVAFLALHGRGGEDGCIQGLLEWLQIPYTGSGVLASALAMDKLKAKELFRLHNVPTPPYYTARTADLENLDEIHGSFGYPAIVKPRSEGSSVGLAKAGNLAQLEAGIRQALEHDEFALVERFVQGAEIQVGLLDGRVLGAIEVAPHSGLYDYASKYTPGATDYFLPPRLAATRVRGLMNLAERAVRALGCTGACRVDLLATAGENEYVLEVNTLPGLTPTSLLPKIAAEAGMDYATLCEEILKSATLHARLGARSETTRTAEVAVLAETAQPIAIAV
ncbi:MAG: D-alanine--D-alanine ligase [Proteobacteria bacterium]|nr:MAG: D-alanine--D-alanine ligase [Pseudomonadota bacterium]